MVALAHVLAVHVVAVRGQWQSATCSTDHSLVKATAIEAGITGDPQLANLDLLCPAVLAAGPGLGHEDLGLGRVPVALAVVTRLARDAEVLHSVLATLGARDEVIEGDLVVQQFGAAVEASGTVTLDKCLDDLPSSLHPHDSHPLLRR